MIGRKKEIDYLNHVLASSESQLIALTGRRRIGKTYLIRNFFKEKIKYMEVVGKKDAKKEESIELFIDALNSYFALSVKIPVVKTWKLAFQSFTEALHGCNAPFVLFLDELPWLAGSNPELLSELDHFWNTKWSQIPNFKLIVCGSATSWILDHIINNKSGLHNRLTGMLHLQPFTLLEVEEYLKEKEIILNRRQIIDLYLCIGGVPYYLDWVKRNMSVPQIIQDLCFSENGRLGTEYEALLDSLFIKSKNHDLILSALSGKRYGLTNKEMEEETGITQGGTLTDLLRELEACHFIKRYYPFGSARRNSYYRLVDEFVLFHYKWIQPSREKGFKLEKDYWLKRYNSAEFLTWAGYNFETICHKHVDAILVALGISGIKTDISHWNKKVEESLGFKKSRYQIDLVIDRGDKVVNLCEVKYATNPLVLDKTLVDEIQERESVFKAITKTRKQIASVIVSASDVVGGNASQFPIVYGEQLFI